MAKDNALKILATMGNPALLGVLQYHKKPQIQVYFEQRMRPMRWHVLRFIPICCHPPARDFDSLKGRMLFYLEQRILPYKTTLLQTIRPSAAAICNLSIDDQQVLSLEDRYTNKLFIQKTEKKQLI